MTNHVFQCNKYQERIKDIKSGKIMIFYNDSICKVIVFLCKIKMKVTSFLGILLITGHIFKMFFIGSLNYSRPMGRPIPAGLSKVAGCRRKSLPTWHFSMDSIFEISLDCPLALTTQQSSLKLSANLPLAFSYQCKRFRP